MRLRALIEAKFEAEEKDPAWSDAATSRVATDLIQRLPTGSELFDVDCRRSICRVKATHPGGSEHMRFARDLLKMSVDDWTGGMLVTADESPPAETRTVAYLGRSGIPLPTLETATP
jgi:hypothetical protein